MVGALEIRLLGPFEVLTGGRLVAVSGSKREALLAFLALRRGRVAAVDELVDALWGEKLPSAPRNAVQHHVARLRAALGPDAIAGAPDGYSLPQADVDAVNFEAALAEARAALRDGDPQVAADSIGSALSLWRGPALQGLTELAWFGAEARRLDALRLDALEEHFEAALALGEDRELVPALRETLDEHPFRERLWGHLMVALYRCGRQADALETFQEARRVLADELGLEPGPSLRHLQEAILAQDPALTVVVPAPRRGNLPTPTTSFVDRTRELAEVIELVRGERLVTLTGPPGVGKSRLALEAARALQDDAADGAWFVELTRAGGAVSATSLLAQAVGARGRDPLARVLGRMRSAEALILFDACEHALEEVGQLALKLLSECPAIKVLATSREALPVAGEVRVSVEPLSVIDSDSPAVELFVARARAARPTFRLTPEAASLAADIARRVDGLPLAIELAAARVNVLGLEELQSIVERRLALLDEAPAAHPGRTALQDLVEWSYELLHGDEKKLLDQLAVHRGGASLPSLLAVAAPQGLDRAMVTYLLQALVDKSIVSVSFPEDEPRYDLLDTVREYALAHLAQSGGLPEARKAHAEYFAALADEAHAGLRGPEWSAWMKRLEREHDNLWAALAYARDAPDPLVAARLAVGLDWYFGTAERVSEGREFTEAALALADDVPLPLRVELLAFACYFATEEGDLDAAFAVGERGAALAAAGDGDARGATPLVTLALSFACNRAGQPERAAALAEEARRAFDGLGDRWGAGLATFNGALGALGMGDIPAATVLVAEALRLNEGYDPGAVSAGLVEGRLAEQRGDMETAEAAYRGVVEVSEHAGFPDHASFAWAGLGSLAFAERDLAGAEARYRRALTLAEAATAPWLVAHAKAKLAEILELGGDTEGASALYGDVLAWSEEPRRHGGREALFIALAGNPRTAALAALDP